MLAALHQILWDHKGFWGVVSLEQTHGRNLPKLSSYFRLWIHGSLVHHTGALGRGECYLYSTLLSSTLNNGNMLREFWSLSEQNDKGNNYTLSDVSCIHPFMWPRDWEKNTWFPAMRSTTSSFAASFSFDISFSYGRSVYFAYTSYPVAWVYVTRRVLGWCQYG